ncbi:MAG: hypothetical protein L0G39_18915 [Chryseobacterium sp.]|nr:hypothetical protein [Chryseobacterium sp.]
MTGVKIHNGILNVYDAKGRILENDQVGTIKYENSAKIYQPTGMTLNAAGTQSYNNDLIQSIVYNENNDPVFIDGEKGDVAFQYGLSNMRQKVSYGGNFDPDQEGKFTKYYSEDGSFEVLKDNITGKEKHILYIGGTPYESNIIYLKNYDETNGSYKFLHKDYLGSILAISDEAGNKLEQRHFDAWGNFTHLQIGNGSIVTDKNIIDTTSLLVERGYTSHEHFAEVGIIHMNGRLYDPLLRRFLNADENIQDPTNTQNYNKYGYVLNNPLMYNDPSGEFAFAVLVAVMAKAAFAAVAITAATYTATALIKGNWTVSGFFRSISSAAITGMVSGALSFGIGTLFQVASIANSLGTTGVVLARAGLHAVSMGVLSSVTGSSFWSGAASGAFASLSGDLLNGVKEGFFGSDAGKLATGITAGGVGSVLAGGNFWHGAMNGFFVTAFNYLEHKIQISILKSQLKAKYTLDGKPDFSDEGIQKMIENVPELKRLYELGGKMAVIKAIEYIPVEGGVTPSRDMGITYGAKVFISKALNLTNWDLATTLGHEMIHVYHNFNLRASWKITYNDQSGRRATLISEVEAYNWEIDMGNIKQGTWGQTKSLNELRNVYKINYTPKKSY